MKTIITIISMLFCVSMFAQTNFYEVTKTFHENGYTYQCDVPPGKLVTLYNKSNTLTYMSQVYISSGEILPVDNRVGLLEDDSWTKLKCKSIVNNAFSVTEKLRMKGHGLTTSMYISPKTGKIIEVDFNFTSFSPYATVPVSVYRKIELELKKNIWFTPTAEGKKLNYLIRFWNQEVK